MISKEDFYEWKTHKVTEIILGRLHQEEVAILERLALNAGIDPLEDRKLCGMIAALRDIIYTHFEDMEEDS